jgi:hypothetical protein
MGCRATDDDDDDNDDDLSFELLYICHCWSSGFNAVWTSM